MKLSFITRFLVFASSASVASGVAEICEGKCEIDLHVANCKEALNKYEFRGDCCSLQPVGGCQMVTTGECYYKEKGKDGCFTDPDSGEQHCIEPGYVYYGQTDEKCPHSEYPINTKDGSGYGEPHFRTWDGRKYDFQGECDLVLLQNPNFQNGLGMNIHIRTTIKSFWSYISTAAIQVGDNILEITGGTHTIRYLINGEETANMETGDTSLGDFPVHFTRWNEHSSMARIDLGHGDAISVETFKDLIRVNTKDKSGTAYKGSAGLLGTYPSGAMLARDGETFVPDANKFGQEWQVRASEPQLFHSTEGVVQHPVMCAMPDENKKAQERRRLGESAITEADAALACAHANEDDFDACVFDVLATNDKDLAGSY